MTVALALAAESVLTMPTTHGDLALRNVLRLHPRTVARLDHDGPVTAVAFSPDGTRVATASGDGSARVFDAATGAELARLDHDGAGEAVAFSPDGTRVATASGRRVGAGVRRGHRGRAGPAGPRRPGVCGGVQPGRHPGRHRQQRVGGSARVFDAATGAELARLDHDGR